MDDSLPSYGEATTRDYWSIVAPFVRSADLCSSALVCRRWNAIFSPQLWGNPASRFGPENDAVYVALVRFKRTLVWADAMTRSLTHTMHFPPAQAEIYDGPRPEWLFDILRWLPYLQSLVVSRIPFFDFSSLSSLVKLSRPGTVHTSLRTYHLRLLDASDCNNVTPQSLSAALRFFPGLVYLDVSGTIPARYHDVLTAIASLPALQILKLQRLDMADDQLTTLICASGRKLRNLDLRHNRITDHGVQDLVQGAVRSSVGPSNVQNSCARVGTKIQQILNSEKQEAHVRKRLTTGFVSDLGIEAEVGHGITHLYVSDNQITSIGASDLLRCRQLQVLDIGELSLAKATLPRLQQLTPIIEEGGSNLTYLRINHAIITELSSSKEAKAFELEDTSKLGLTTSVAELELSVVKPRELSGNPVHEAAGTIPIYAELEGSPVDAGPSGAIVDSQDETYIVSPTGRSESAPEPVSALPCLLDSSGGLLSPVSPLVSRYNGGSMHAATGRHFTISEMTSLPEVLASIDPEIDPRSANRGHQARLRSYSGVLIDHEARTRFRQSQDHSLLAATLGEIRTLVLTNVPRKSCSQEIAQRIIEFIKDCAEQERWAALKASVGYQLPPGLDRQSAELLYARTLFPFRKLVLEMAPEHLRSSVADNGRTLGRMSSITSNMLSSTLDPDCEAYLNAAKNDFSFFASEECGQPDAEGAAPVSLAALQEKIPIEPDTTNHVAKAGNSRAQEPIHDVLAHVSRFRRSRKAEYEIAVARGENHVDGYWGGVIEVVRPRA